MTDWKPRDTERARALRNAATPAERALWQHLSRRQTGGAKFCRQLQIGHYYADFLCRELALVVECDGFSHDLRPEHDGSATPSCAARVTGYCGSPMPMCWGIPRGLFT